MHNGRGWDGRGGLYISKGEDFEARCGAVDRAKYHVHYRQHLL